MLAKSTNQGIHMAGLHWLDGTKRGLQDLTCAKHTVRVWSNGQTVSQGDGWHNSVTHNRNTNCRDPRESCITSVGHRRCRFRRLLIRPMHVRTVRLNLELSWYRHPRNLHGVHSWNHGSIDGGLTGGVSAASSGKLSTSLWPGGEHSCMATLLCS
jgi:hypothetical protein